MDFIERLFGIAPDGGSGTLEFLLFALPLAVCAAWLICDVNEIATRQAAMDFGLSMGPTTKRAA